MKTVFYTVLHFLLLWPIRIIFRIRVKGKKNEPCRKDGPYLVCANHQTVLDPVFIAAATSRQQPHFMAKESLFRVFFLGRLVRWLGAFPVSRGRSDVGAIKHTIQLIESGRSVGMFPQGTRCPGEDPKNTKVKPGVGMIAARTGVQILPVFIGMKDQKWKFFRRVRIVVGEPIPFERFGYDKEQPGEYARISAEVFAEICRLGDTLK